MKSKIVRQLGAMLIAGAMLVTSGNVTMYAAEQTDENAEVDVAQNEALYGAEMDDVEKLEKGDGDIFIDGKNINSLTRKDISEIIALVPQSPFLIAGTIYENICYGMDKEVSLEEVEEAAKKAYIYDYINNLPDKFNTLISEGGNNLSGGQRQRIAIARIFLRKPKILILDEATSALDNTSERHIQIEIEKLQKENNTTIISIAHRLTTLKNCDRIIVLNKGKIEEDGKYTELIEREGIFKDMYYGKLK